MKTTTLLNNQNFTGNAPYKILPPVITITFGFFLFFLVPSLIRSQNNSTEKLIANTNGMSLGIFTTGSGLTASYSFQAYHERKNWLVFAGPLFQFKNNKFSGIQAGCEYTVVGNEKIENVYGGQAEPLYPSNVELFFFAKEIFRTGASLNRACTRIEEQYFSDSGISFPSLNLQSLELYSGFGLRVKCAANLKISGSIGVGGYSYIKNNYALYHDNCGVGLILNTGISWGFSTAFKKNNAKI